jgi:hypothetical protein
MEVNTEMNLLNLISLWFDDITLHLVFQIGIQPFPWRKIKHAFHLATHPHCCLWQELVTKLCQLPRSLMITDRSGQVAIGNCVHVKSWRLQAGAGFYCWVRSSDWPAEAGPGTTLTDPDWSYRTKQKGRPFSKQACTASALPCRSPVTAPALRQTCTVLCAQLHAHRIYACGGRSSGDGDACGDGGTVRCAPPPATGALFREARGAFFKLARAEVLCCPCPCAAISFRGRPRAGTANRAWADGRAASSHACVAISFWDEVAYALIWRHLCRCSLNLSVPASQKHLRRGA